MCRFRERFLINAAPFSMKRERRLRIVIGAVIALAIDMPRLPVVFMT
jgi:hypothetical protein